MSNDISYTLKVVDDFSATFQKFRSGSAQLTQQLSRTETQFTKATKSQKFFTDNLKDLGKASAIYVAFQAIKNLATSAFDTKIQMDSLNASLTAIMPRFDQTKPATQLAAQEMDYLRDVTTRLGISFKEALPAYVQFLASSKQDLATTRKTFEAFSGISRLYGLSSQRFGLVITALNQMQSKGVISMEELRQQLGESLPGALDLFAEAAGMSTAKFVKLVSEGKIGAGLLKIVAENIEKKFGKDIVNASKTLGAETEKLGNSFIFLKGKIGDQFEPVMRSTITQLADATKTFSDFISAINNQSAFSKLSDDGKAFVTILRITKGLLEGIVEEIKLIGSIAKGGWNLGKNVVTGAVLARQGAVAATKATIGAATGDEFLRESASQDLGNVGEAFKMLWNQTADIFSSKNDEQKVTVDVNLNNAPRGTTVEVSKPNGKNVRVGNMVNYETQGAY